MTETLSSSPDLIAYHHFVEFLNDIKEYENSGASSLNSVYSDYADTPTRKRNRILQKRNETLEKLETSSVEATAFSLRKDQSCGHLLNIKFVGLLVQLLCDEACVDGRTQQKGNGSLNERFDVMLQIFLNAIQSVLPLETCWRQDLKISLNCPRELSVVELCRLPSAILDNLELHRQQGGQHSKKRFKSDGLSNYTSYKHSLLQTHAILGYLVTFFIAHDLKGIVPLHSLQRHVQELVVSCGLVEDRLYSMEYDAVISGSIAYFLDCMDVSSMTMEEGYEVNNDESAQDKTCIIGDEFIVEDVQVGMIVDLLTNNRNSVFLTFQDVIDPENRRAVVSRIAKTLLYYTLNHVRNDVIASNDCMSIWNFIDSASSPETAQRYLNKMNDLAACSEKKNSLGSGNKRKNDCIISPLQGLSIDPILIELQVLLCIPKLKSAISLVQALDEQPYISKEDKAKGWFQLLDFLHQKDMLLNESRNARFHSLTVGSKTGLDSILQFFQGIVHQVIDEVDKAAEERGGIVTDVEERWIRYHQLKVRKTLLKFCFRRAAFSSSNGLRALEVASQVSGIKLEENNYSSFLSTQNTVWSKINEILLTEINVPEKPLYLIGPSLELDDKPNDEIHHIHDANEESLDKSKEASEQYPNRDDIVPPSPANVPFVAEPIYETDGSEQMHLQKDDNTASGVDKNVDAAIEISDQNCIDSTGGTKQNEEIILSDSEDSAIRDEKDEQESVEVGGVVQENMIHQTKFDEDDNVSYENDHGEESNDDESYDDSIDAEQAEEEEEDDDDEYDSFESDEKNEISNRLEKPQGSYHSIDDNSEGQSYDENQYEENSSYSEQNKEYLSDEVSTTLNSQPQRETFEIGDSSDEDSACTPGEAADIQTGNDGRMSSEGESVEDENSSIDESEAEVLEIASDDSNEDQDSNMAKKAMVTVPDISEKNNRNEAPAVFIPECTDKNDGISFKQDVIEHKDVAIHSDAVIVSNSRGNTVNGTLKESLEGYSIEKKMTHGTCSGKESSEEDYSTASESDNERVRSVSSKESIDEARSESPSAVSLSINVNEDVSADNTLTKNEVSAPEDKSTDSSMRREENIDRQSSTDDYSTASEADNDAAMIVSSVEYIAEASNAESVSKDPGKNKTVDNEPTKNQQGKDNDDEKSDSDNYTTASELDNEEQVSGNSVKKHDDPSTRLINHTSTSIVRGENAESKNTYGDEHDNNKRLLIDNLRDRACMANDVEPNEVCDHQSPEVEYVDDLHKTAAIDQGISEEQGASTNVPYKDEEAKEEEHVRISEDQNEAVATIYNEGDNDKDIGASESSGSSGATNESPEEIPMSTDLDESLALNQDVSEKIDETTIESNKAADEPAEDMGIIKDQEETVSIDQKTANDKDAVANTSSQDNQAADQSSEDLPISNNVQHSAGFREAVDDIASPSNFSKVSKAADESRRDLSVSKDFKETAILDEKMDSNDQLIVMPKQDNAEIEMNALSKDEESISTTRNVGEKCYTAEEVSKMSYRRLQKECKARGLSAKGSAEELAKRVLDTLDVLRGQVRSPQKHAGDDKSSTTADSIVDKNDIAQEQDVNPQDDYSTFSYKELQKACMNRGLSGRGKKDELRRRLQEMNTINIPKDEGSCRDDDLSTVSYRDLQLMCKERGINAKGKHEILLDRLKKAISTEDGRKKGEQHIVPLESNAIGTIENAYTDVAQNKSIESQAESAIINSKPSSSRFTTWASEKLSSMVDMLSPSSHRSKGREEADEDNNRLEADSTASPNIPKNIDFPVPGSAGTLSLLSPEDHSVISMSSSIAEKGQLNPLVTKKKRAGRPPKPPIPSKKSKTETRKVTRVDTPRTRSRAKENASVASRTTRSSARRLTRSGK